MFDREHRAGAPETALDFIRDQQDAVPVGKGAQGA